MTVLLARHGETDYNAERRFQGQGDVPLNARGREQAHELAALAATHELRALYASPVARARETAEIVAAAVGLPIRWDERFAETHVGDWQDRFFADVERDDPEGWAGYRGGGQWRFPGGESLPEQLARVDAGLQDVRAAGELPALVVCHRGVIRLALLHAQELPLEQFHDVDVPNGSLVELP